MKKKGGFGLPFFVPTLGGDRFKSACVRGLRAVAVAFGQGRQLLLQLIDSTL